MNDEVIGIGSLHGWKRSQIAQEYSEIVKAAEKGGKSLEEWDAMQDVLCKLYIGTDCERFSTLVRLFLFGRFERLFLDDIGGKAL
ncbi:hypothetical protein KOEU_37130 [Komagataeibacter europaeus]|uniref:Uncharacterized protein n=1 Tax=Komagataeibacter europaeus TaxID=33995 RepID=A0A0M0EC20_KOMEU|nr:hypothetical protein [Komagataeibacter europaeus]KON62795.1 hypothetical protein KOEU_37130 [Komagataeibacter europaeus]